MADWAQGLCQPGPKLLLLCFFLALHFSRGFPWEFSGAPYHIAWLRERMGGPLSQAREWYQKKETKKDLHELLRHLQTFGMRVPMCLKTLAILKQGWH